MLNVVKATALLLAAAAVPAAAVPIKYTITGDFTGFIGTSIFAAAPLTFTGIGNTSAAVDYGAFTLVPVALTISNPFGAGSIAVTDKEAFGVYPAGGNVYFSKVDTAGQTTYSFPVIANNSAFATYSGVSFKSATPTLFGGSAPFATTSGAVVLLGGTNLTFTAAADAVPEPATWLMLLTGFGLVGGAARARHRSAVTA